MILPEPQSSRCPVVSAQTIGKMKLSRNLDFQGKRSPVGRERRTAGAYADGQGRVCASASWLLLLALDFFQVNLFSLLLPIST